MNLVAQNPFRIIGVLTNASEKELLKQKNRFSAFARAGKLPSSELDFNFLSPIVRDDATIKEAFSAIELAEDRVFHALFWFSNNNTTDEVVIDNFKLGNDDKAVEILEKFTKDKAISTRNITHFNNLSSYHLACGSVLKGLWVKLQIIESTYFANFTQEVVDKTANINAEKIIDRIIDIFIEDIKTVKDPLTKFGIPNGYVRNTLRQKLTGEHIAYIEKRIEAANDENTENAWAIYSTAKSLFANSQEKLVSIIQILGTEDLQYQMLSDKVAETLRSLSIRMYNNAAENQNVIDQCQSILDDAYVLATQTQTIHKIEEDRNTLIEKGKEEQSHIYLEKIVKELNNLDSCSLAGGIEYIKNAAKFASDVKNTLGDNEIYQTISTAIVIRSLNFCVEKINEAQDVFSRRMANDSKIQWINNLLSHIDWALQIIVGAIYPLYKTTELAKRYEKDKSQLLRMRIELIAIKQKLYPKNTNTISSENNTDSNKEPDYINHKSSDKLDSTAIIIIIFCLFISMLMIFKMS